MENSGLLGDELKISVGEFINDLEMISAIITKNIDKLKKLEESIDKSDLKVNLAIEEIRLFKKQTIKALKENKKIKTTLNRNEWGKYDYVENEIVFNKIVSTFDKLYTRRKKNLRKNNQKECDSKFILKQKTYLTYNKLHRPLKIKY